jgi:hypothetical protein
MRVDGKFIVNNEIPEGQATVVELLDECFELAYDLRVAAAGDSPGSHDEAVPV